MPKYGFLEDIDIDLRQRALSHAIDEASFQHLLSSADSNRSRALALSSALPHAGDWLNVVPSPSLGLHLQDREYRCCLLYWLGVPLHSNPFPCPKCRGVADVMGDHQVGCGGNGDRISRHNAIRDVLFSAAQSAALAPSKETPGFVPNSLARPADILLPNWHQGRPAFVDVHVISPLQQLTLAEASSIPGHALLVGTRRKLASNLPACRAMGAECIPLVTETLGGLSEDAIHTIRAIGHAIGIRSCSPDPSTSTKHLFSRTAIALWRGNATLWLHRHLTLPPSLDGVIPTLRSTILDCATSWFARNIYTIPSRKLFRAKIAKIKVPAIRFITYRHIFLLSSVSSFAFVSTSFLPDFLRQTLNRHKTTRYIS